MIRRSLAGRRPQFAAFTPANSWNINAAVIAATYGPPSRILTVAGVTVIELPPKP